MSIKRLVKAFIASGIGWPTTARLLRAPGVTVLMYHRVPLPNTLFDGCDVDLFREQMRWLKRHCRPIHPDELSRHAEAGAGTRPPVLVTFDDGYRDYFDNAYPILKEFEIPAVVFLATSFMDNGGMIWTDEVTWAVAQAPDGQFNLPWDASSRFDFAQSEQRNHFRDQAKLHLKGIPDAERKDQLARLFEILMVKADRSAIDRQMLSWNEVRASQDLTTYGGHSHTHPIMSQLDKQAMEWEIKTCRDRIEAETGRSPKYFAYPNGRQQDFNDTTKSLLKQHGFALAFSTVLGSNDHSMDPLAIKRIHNGDSARDMACLIAGIARA
jgi:peptidoglycan/xylan/chitin deacetylase (PgdA/CDA1 family)